MWRCLKSIFQYPKDEVSHIGIGFNFNDGVKFSGYITSNFLNKNYLSTDERKGTAPETFVGKFISSLINTLNIFFPSGEGAYRWNYYVSG